MAKLRKIGSAKNIRELTRIFNGYDDSLPIGFKGKGVDVCIGGGKNQPYFMTMKSPLKKK